MNCAFALSDMQYDKNFGKYDSVSVLHSLFDGLLQPNLGSQSVNSLTFFSKILQTLPYEDISRIVDKSLKLEKRQVRREILNLFELNSETGFKHVAEKIAQTAGNYFGADSNTVKQTSFFLLDYYLSPSETLSQEDPGEEKFEGVQYILRILIQALLPMVKRFIRSNPSMLMSSGWSTHLIGFYYEQVDRDRYRYGLFNSGRGIDLHEQLNNTHYSVCKLFYGSLDDLETMIAYVHIYKNYLEEVSFLPSHKLFYDCLPSSKSQLESYPDFLKDMRWVEPQLSGTCTYFGFLYAIQYMFYSANRKLEFKRFLSKIEQISVASLVDYLDSTSVVSQKHKIFLDLIAPRISDRSITDKLYLRYADDVSEFTNTRLDIQDSFSDLYFSIYNHLDDNIFVYPRTNPVASASLNLIHLLKNILSTMKKISKRSKVLEFFEEYIYLASVAFFVRDVSLLPDSAYILEDSELSRIPGILLDLYTQVHILVSKLRSKTVPFAISFVFKIILIRFNENSNRYYFEQSSNDYDPRKIHDYYMSLSTLDEKSLHLFTGYLPVQNDYFHLMKDYYDLILSDKYVKEKTVDNQTFIKFKLFDYCKYFSSSLMKNLKSPEDVYRIFTNVNRVVSSIFLIMYNIDISAIVRYDDRRNIVSHTWSVDRQEDTVYIDHLSKAKFDKSTVFSAQDDLLRITSFFVQDRVEELNRVYDEKAWVRIHGKFLSHHRFFVNTDFSTISLSRDPEIDSLAVSDNIVQDYVNIFENRRAVTSVLITEDSLQKIFGVLNDVATIFILNIIMYYHNDLSTSSKQIILSNCSTKIKNGSEYEVVYKMISMMLSDTRRYELDVVKEIRKCLKDSIRRSNRKIYRYELSEDGVLTTLTSDVILYELYKTYLLYLPRSELIEHFSRIQESIREDYYERVVANYREVYPNRLHINQTVVTHPSTKNELIHSQTTIFSTIETEDTIILGELRDAESHSTSFFKQFILQVVNGNTIVGLSANPNAGSFRLESVDNNLYNFYRLFRYKTENGTEKVLTLKAIKNVIQPSRDDSGTDSENDLDTVSGTASSSEDSFGNTLSYLDNDWIQQWRLYKNIFFYHDEDNGSVYVEFVDFLSESAQRPLLLRTDPEQNWYFVDDEFREHKLETQDNPFMINRWIYGMPFSFVYRDGLNYKIIYVDSPLSRGKILYGYQDVYSTYHWWVDSSVRGDIDRFLSSLTYPQHSSYYVAQIEYHSMGCIFSSVEAMRSYLFSCIMFMKVDCMDMLLTKYLSLLSSKEKSHDPLIECISKGFVNNPYSHYFQNRVSQHTLHDPAHLKDIRKVYSINESYQIRLNRNIYQDKFSTRFSTPKSSDFDIRVPSESFILWFGLRSTDPNARGSVQSFDKWFTLESDSSSHQVYIETVLGELSSKPQSDFSKKFSILYQNILSSVQFFNSKYEKCVTGRSLDYANLLFTTLELEYQKRILDIVNVPGFFQKLYGQSVEQFVVDLADKFYELLAVKIAYDVLVDISSLRADRECLEIKTIYDKINEKTVYGGKRTSTEILFEIFYGSYIRKEQHEIYTSIINSIEADPTQLQSYSVYQLLMGKGKSSVIMPLLTFRYLYAFEDLFNIFIILPHHLINQTYQFLAEKFYPILNNIWILSLQINRYDLRTEYADIFDYYNQTVMKFRSQKKLFIMTDTSYKSLKLNIVTRDPTPNNSKLDHLQKNSVAIFDEFDSQYNPITSDLNFPDPVKSLQSRPIISQEIIDLFVDLILDTGKTSNPKTFKNRLITLCEQRNLMTQKTAKRLLSNKQIPVTKHATFSKRCTIYQMFIQLLACLKMRFRKDYGFPKNDSHTNRDLIYLAVPYNSVDTPIIGSEFSDIDVCTILTIMSYMYYGVRKIDIVNFVNRIRAKIVDISANLSVTDLDSVFRTERSLLNLDTIASIRDASEYSLGAVCDKIHRDLITNSKTLAFLKHYLKSEILPRIHFTERQTNCSFMDVIGSDMCYYKAGFTGTVFIDLPRYEDQNRVFVNTTSNMLSDGAMYAALLGVYQTDREIHNFQKTYLSRILDPLIDLIHRKQYRVLIDAGAFLRLYSKKSVVETLSTRLDKRVVYVDDLDTVRIYYGGKTTQFQMREFNTSELFYYYDNKHVIGTDIQHPYSLKGLVTVSSFNDLAEISQATFRMRNLNYGHTVNYVLRGVDNVTTNAQLVYSLFDKLNRKINSSVKLKQIEQEIKMYHRLKNYSHHQENVFNVYELFHYVDIFNKYKDVLPRDIVRDLHKNSILSTWMIHPSKEMNVSHWSEQLNILLNTDIPHTVSVNQEQVTEVATDKTKNIARAADVFDTTSFSRNRSDLFYPKLIVSTQYSLYFTYTEWRKLRHEFAPRNTELTISSQKRSLLKFNEVYAIYWSPLLLDDPYWTKDAWSVADISIKQHANYPNRYIRLLDSHSYYYVKYYDPQEKDSYLLVSSRECSELLKFAKQSKSRSSVWIRDKYGHTLYGPDDSLSVPVSAKELFVRILLGKIPTLLETFILHAYMRKDDTLARALRIFSDYYMVEIFDTTSYQKYLYMLQNGVESYRDRLRSAVTTGSDLEFFVGTSLEPYLNTYPSWRNYLQDVLSKTLVIYEDLSKIDDVLLDISKIVDANQDGGVNYRQLLNALNRKKNKYKTKYLALKQVYDRTVI